MQDIFVPESNPEDALASPLHTVTYVTADRETVSRMLEEGYGLTPGEWIEADADMRAYLGFDAVDAVSLCVFAKQGEGANVQVRVAHVPGDVPVVRPEYDGLYRGGATISAPMKDMAAHEKRMRDLGIDSTIGVKVMDFTSPQGEVYTSGEIAYMAPENVFMLGVTRPDIFLPTGPVDEELGIGGPSYSARCIGNTDKVLDFFRTVLGYEIRRDIELTVGERSALFMPEGTKERFIQAFAPGAATGYVVLMDHGALTKEPSAPRLGPPFRGIAQWSFTTRDFDEIARRADAFGATILQPPGERSSPGMPGRRTMVIEDPDGFPIEFTGD